MQNTKDTGASRVRASGVSAKLETRDLTRVVGGQAVVDEIDLSIYEGETIVIVGPSGSGKSSLLRLIVRLDEPTRGTVFLDGTDYRDIDPGTLRRRVGLVLQQPTLTDESVIENVTWASRLRGEPTDQERARTILRQLGLDGYESRNATTLSGGEQQRVSIARTLMNDPEVLLLDEPTSSLDSTAESRVERILTDLIQDLELTVVLVTHDDQQARRLADRVVRLRKGRIEVVGTIEDVFA